MVGVFDVPGPWELIIILGIVLLLFGGKKLPEMARSLGRSSKEFKKGLADAAEEDDKSETPSDPKQAD